MDKNFLLILFYSASGSVKNLAHAIADGAEESGLNTKIRTVPRVSSKAEQTEPVIPEENEIYCTKEDLINCAGMAIGSPTRFGSIASPLKYFLDSTGDIWSNNTLNGKPGLAFTSTGSMHGGQETTIFNLITYMMHQGMYILGTPYSVEQLHSTLGGGTPYGPSHVEIINNANNLTPEEYTIANYSGKRIAKLIKKINA